MSATTPLRPDRSSRHSRRSRAGQARSWQPTVVPPTPATPVVLHPVPDPAPVPRRAPMPPPKRRRIRRWLRAHWLSLLILAGLLLAVGLVHAIGYDRYPGRINDDEGTYVAQAWAVQHWHSLAHYTYWYDHPPGGWITIAGYTWVTRAFERLPTAVSAGREFMVFVKLVSAAMIYLLARRLGYHRLAAAGAVLLFGLSPLAIPYQRMVFLDNLAVMWILAALAFAASPKRSLAASAGSAACFAIAVLSKETIVVLFPAVFLLLWQHTSAKTRRYRVALFLTTFGALVFVYPLYAILKNELLDGPGHVSLFWAIKWQLFDRPPSGSLLDPSSGTYATARSWLEQDPLVLGSGVLLAPLGLLMRHTRAITLALVIQVVMLLRNGYLPFPYVIGMLPFAALTAAGVAHRFCRGPNAKGWHSTAAKRAGQLMVVSALAAIVVIVGPGWTRGTQRAMTADDSRPAKEALAHVVAHVPRGSVLLVDDNLWTDLVLRGYDPNPIWFYKLDLDPAVRARLKNGWRDIDYVVLGTLAPSTLHDLPLVAAAIEHSEVLASFGDGEITVRRVVKDEPDQAQTDAAAANARP
jgi:4-amino-4-deoxy-L-arabinose transferase-like glycosyltransferase